MAIALIIIAGLLAMPLFAWLRTLTWWENLMLLGLACFACMCGGTNPLVAVALALTFGACALVVWAAVKYFQYLATLGPIAIVIFLLAFIAFR
jgi:hypothetical protein